MEDSILISTKKMLGIDQHFDAFDLDIKMHINSVISILHQMGVGKPGFILMDESDTWSDLIEGYSEADINMIKSYIYLKTRLLFDPPTGSIVMEAVNQSIAEFEYRLYALCNYGE